MKKRIHFDIKTAIEGAPAVEVIAKRVFSM